MLLEILHDYKIYLASQSPRRRALLADMDIDFEVVKTDVDETYDPSLEPSQVVQYLSKLKLTPINFSQYDPKTIFIACDTIVVMNGQILGKPKDSEEAMQMVRALSGRTHLVYSGLTVATPKRTLTDFRTSAVTFAELSEEEIEYYVRKYRPLDKAGAYGVQEWIGCIGIQSIHGSFYNVMGLPTCLLWDMLKQIVRS